jgi:hypothetical protein
MRSSSLRAKPVKLAAAEFVIQVPEMSEPLPYVAHESQADLPRPACRQQRTADVSADRQRAASTVSVTPDAPTNVRWSTSPPFVSPGQHRQRFGLVLP